MSQNIQISKYYEEIRSNCKSHREALPIYLKNLSTFQSENKIFTHWSDRKRCAINFTIRQISRKTNISTTQVHRIIKGMESEGSILFYRYKKSKTFNNMKFYYFPELLSNLISKRNKSKIKMREIAFSVYENVCTKCGSRNNLQLDHIYPVSIYKERELDLLNTQILCKKCNFKKFNKNTNDYRSKKEKIKMKKFVKDFGNIY